MRRWTVGILIGLCGLISVTAPDVHKCLPALLLVLEQAAVIDPGSVDRFHPCEWRAGPERDGDRHVGPTTIGSRGPEF